MGTVTILTAGLMLLTVMIMFFYLKHKKKQQKAFDFFIADVCNNKISPVDLKTSIGFFSKKQQQQIVSEYSINMLYSKCWDTSQQKAVRVLIENYEILAERMLRFFYKDGVAIQKTSGAASWCFSPAFENKRVVKKLIREHVMPKDLVQDIDAYEACEPVRAYQAK